MECVNISSSQFKKLAKRNNINTETLEMLVHQYWIETGSDEFYPTDVYIQAKLGNVRYEEPIEAVRKLWNIKYNTPQEFKTLKEAQKAMAKALKVFPKEAVTYHITEEGNYVLTVKQPVEKMPSTLEDFLNKNSSAGRNHFGMTLSHTSRNSLLQIHDSNKRQFVFMDEEELKTAYKNLIQHSNISSEETKSLIEAIDKMTKKQILDEISLMDREQEDFENLLHSQGISTEQMQQTSRTNANTATDIEENDDIQLSVESVRHTFTFKDGITVETPFQLNNEQQDALLAMDAFIHSSNPDNNVMTLSGYAGTGKTSLMEILAAKIQKEKGKNIIFSATTNKAAGVLKKKVSRVGDFWTTTIHRVLNLYLAADDTKQFDTKAHLLAQGDTDKLPEGSIVVIDEASMINEKLYKKIINTAEAVGLKIIFVGDEAQLAPVGEDRISIVFRDNTYKSNLLKLKKVERTGDNAILEEATNLRNNRPLTKRSKFNPKGEGVAYIKSSNRQEINKVIRHFIPRLKEDADSFRILAYHKAAVENYNKIVRDLLGYHDYIPRIGEPVVGYQNWGQKGRGENTYRFVNSESYTVTNVGEVRTVKDHTYKNEEIISFEFDIIPITLKDALGELDTFEYIDVKGNQKNYEQALKLAQIRDDLWAKAIATKDATIRKQLFKEFYRLGKYNFVNADIMIGDRTIQEKVIDFGYAMTVHKSQGSTFTHVLIDDVDISTAEGLKEDGERQAMGTVEEAMEEASRPDLSEADARAANEDIIPQGEKKPIGFNWRKIAESMGINTGSLMASAPNEPMKTKQRTQSSTEEKTASELANIRQQLKYVAVSRATTTATIISTNVEVEDSPLNHLQNSSVREDSNKEDENKEVLTTSDATLQAEGFIGEVDRSPYKKVGNKFVVREDTPTVKVLNAITTKGHKPERGPQEEPYDGQVSYNVGYTSGSKAVMSVTNRDLYSEGWKPSTILLRRESGRINQPVDIDTTIAIDSFKEATFLVEREDSNLIAYLKEKGYKYRLYSDLTQAAKEKTQTALSETWKKAQDIKELPGRREISYRSPGQPRRNYYVEGEHIYNEEGKEVFANKETQRTHRNKIFANLAIREGRAVVVNYRGYGYVVTNTQDIISERTGEIVYVDNKSTMRGIILGLAEQAFKTALDKAPTTTSNISPASPTSDTSTTKNTGNVGEWVTIGDKQIQITSTKYRKGDPQNNTDTAYIFTENAQANAVALGLDDSWIEDGYLKGDKVKLDVSDMGGDNQAGIRAIKDRGQIQLSPNAFGIIVKKYQQKKGQVRFLQEEGQFKDTDDDFELFKAANLAMFQRLEASGLKKIVFPGQMGKGKAALPYRFAEWLQAELKNRFGIISEIQKNTREGYKGYGLALQSINSSPTQQTRQSTEDTPSDSTPLISTDKAIAVKRSITNKFIGFAEGIENSPTAEYAKQAGDKANTGQYDERDTVFVSIPGKEGTEEIRQREQQRTIREALKAIRQGAVLITDSITNIASDNLNEGEKALADALREAGAMYFDKTIDGVTVGQWMLSKEDVKNYAIKQSLISQFTTHINANITNVRWRDAMDKFFREHPQEGYDRIRQAFEEQREMQEIKERALADGTFMLAPNGKKSNLNERQWLQVRTKNFIKWFGDWINDSTNASKVVDENGEPLVVYHNTKNEFTKFSKFRAFLATLTGSNIFGKGFYFANSKGTSLGNINMPVFLAVFNPSEGDMTSKNDGMIHRFDDETVWYAAKKPNQIKSATDNIGTFSTENDDIQLAVADDANIFDEKFAESRDDVISLQQANIFLNNLAQQLESDNKLDDTTIEIFNELINRIQNGEIRIKGTDSQVLGQNRLATILTTLSRFGRERYRTSGRSGQVEKTLNLVRRYLQKTGEWQEQIEVIAKERYGEPSPKSGTESSVYFIGNSAIKLQSLSTAKFDLAEAIERILLQNEFDPTCQIEIIGVGQTQQGEFRLLLRQPHIKDAIIATTAEIKADMEKRGFEYKGEGDYGPIYENTETEEIIEDARSVNVLKTRDGVLHYIDVIPSKNKQNVAQEIKDKNLPFYILKTTTGEVKIYGFIDPETDEMYLDEDIIDLEHPIHEYTHIWDNAVAKRNPKLWKRGVELLKKFLYVKEGKKVSLWQEIENDPNYGLKWKKKVEEGKMKPEKLEFLIASEVHSRLVGEQGSKFILEKAIEQGEKGIIAKLKKWMLDMWKALAETFGAFTDDQLKSLTLADFNHMTLRDLINATNLKGDVVSYEEKSKTTSADKIFEAVKGKDVVVATKYKQNGETVEGEETGEIVSILEIDDGYMINIQIEGQQYPATLSVDKEFNNLNTLSKYKKITLIYSGNEDRGFVSFENFVSEAIKGKEGRLENTPLNTDNMPEESPKTTVSLPNFERLAGLTESIAIPEDESWKISELEVLDTEIDEDNSEEDNNKILEKIMRVLAAKSKEDLKKDAKTVDKLNQYKKLNEQINNLMDNSIIDSVEVRHTAELVVNSISDLITEIQQDPEAAKKYFPQLNITSDLSDKSRKDIVTIIGLDNFINYAKSIFLDHTDAEGNRAIHDRKTRKQAWLLVDNWDALMEFAADYFVMNEGFGISKSHAKDGFDIIKQTLKLLDNDGNEIDVDSILEMEADEQEHWQIKARTVDVMNSMSELVRNALHNCYKLDADGNKILSKWGIPERVDKREAVQSILRWTKGSLTLQDMIDKLNLQKDKNPWLKQLILRLQDKTGKEADFQSQFFGVMNKHFQLYCVVRNKNGKFVSIPINEHFAQTVMMRTIKSKYDLGEHPLFTSTGEINSTALATLEECLKELKSFANANEKTRREKEEQKKLGYKDSASGIKIELSEEERKKAYKYLRIAAKTLGLEVPEDVWANVIDYTNIYNMTFALKKITEKLNDVLRENIKNYQPFAFKKGLDIGGTIEQFLQPIADHMENTAISSFFDNGNMYQSYVIPSFLTKLMNKFRDQKNFKQFLMEEYGKSEWFYKDGRWRLSMMQRLYNSNGSRIGGEDSLIGHKVELSFNSHSYMENMTDGEYALSLLTQYWSEHNKGEIDFMPAWFRVPMLSNKPSSEFIRLNAYTGSDYKNKIVDEMFNIFLQEVDRITTVRMRNKKKGSIGFIKNFDKNGLKFCFLPFLNEHLTDTAKGRLAELLKKKLDTTKALSPDEAGELMKLVKEAIYQHMSTRAKQIIEQWKSKGIIEAAKKIEGIAKEKRGKVSDAEVTTKLENFIWNDNLASKIILELTIGDIAFYKDAEDLQKRLAQIHAPGIRANIYATDYNLEGNKEAQRVSDGYYRTFVIKDFDNFVSNIIDNISEVFERRIARAKTKEEKDALKALKDSLVRPRTYKENGEVDDPGGAYWNINVADAQGYSSPSSYRKKALMFGKWSRKAEDIYNKLLSGEYKYTDLKTAFQPLKPFVYSRIQKNTDVDNAPITNIYAPFQAKNAEYLLIMADAIIQSEEKHGKLSRPNLLRAIYRVMEDSAYDNRTYNPDGTIKDKGTYNRRGIDTVQFESAIKSNLQSPIDIQQFAEMPDGEERAYAHIREQIYKKKTVKNSKGEEERVYDEYDEVNFVQKGSFEDYCLQQEVPEHFRNHEQAHGSQIRMIIPSDLDLYKNPNADPNDSANQVYYEWEEPDGKGGKTIRREPAEKFRKEYEETISANIEEALEELSKELHLDSTDKKERNIILSEFLQREIKESPRYGIDLFQACQIDEKTGEFRIPKGDPIQAKRIEQLLNSLIKNRVNKQTIPGGPIVQVSNFGTSRQLHIRFNARSGGLLKTKEEFVPDNKYKTYEEYCKAEQAGIAYFECYVPIWSEELVEKFGMPDGTIDIKAMEELDPDLLKMVSYRIPTEDKYSCAPMKVVGFLPREAGEAIILPYELTGIDGSDFDVDKRYVMRKDITINKDVKRADMQYALESQLTKSWKKAHPEQEPNEKWIKEQVKMFLDNPEEMKSADALMASLWRSYIRQAYETIHPTEATDGRKFRNNKIIDMSWGVLTNEMTADKILNPGGFDEQKAMGYMISAYKNPANRGVSWESLEGKSVEALKDLSYVEKDLTWVDTQLHFYHQNNAGSSLIGVFAVNKVAHATLGGDNIFISIPEVTGEGSFTIAGFKFSNLMEVDTMYDSKGNLIGKTLGSLVAASADTAKDPVLDLMNINMFTAGMLTTMLRLGMPFQEAALFLSQDIITKMLNELNRRRLIGKSVSIEKLINEWMHKYEEENNINDSSAIHTQELSKKELIQGLRRGESSTAYKVLDKFLKIKALSDQMRNITFATRFNSISSAVGPQIIDNLVLEHKMEAFDKAYLGEEKTHFYIGTKDKKGNLIEGELKEVDIKTIIGGDLIVEKETGKEDFGLHPILHSFSKTVELAKILFNDMPVGSIGFRTFLRNIERVYGKKFMESLYKDRKTLDQLSVFYQSYMLVDQGLINTNHRDYYVNKFPRLFFANKVKEKYPDNPLIQAIQLQTSAKTKRVFLKVNIAGMSAQEKEMLSSAWLDLHKKDPKLSMALFNYCFFIAGIGFSPKTFISLANTYLKERIKRTDAQGKEISYVEIFRHLPAMAPYNIIDQFIRNNWDNTTLVKTAGGENTHYDYKNGGKVVEVHYDNEVAELTGVPYIKIKRFGITSLYKLEGLERDNQETRIYKKIDPLGDNHEYLEISNSNIDTAMTETTKDLEDLDTEDTEGYDDSEVSFYMESEHKEIEDTEPDTIIEASQAQQAKDIAEAAGVLLVSALETEQTPLSMDEGKLTLKKFSEKLESTLKEKGVTYNEEEVKKETDKYC